MRSRTGRPVFAGLIRRTLLACSVLLPLAPLPLNAQPSLFGRQDFERGLALARAAQTAGDCVAFERRVRDLKDVNDGFQYRDSRTWSDNASTINKLVAEGCPKRATLAGPRGTLYQPSVEVGVDLQANKITVPLRTFLGTEVNGSFQPRLGLITPDDDGSGTGVNGFVKIDMTNFFNLPFGQTPPKTSFVRFGINRSEFDLTQGFGNIDPGANTDLLIAGPLGGPSGFSIGPNAIVTGALYGLNYSETGFYGDIGIESNYEQFRTQLEAYVRGSVTDVNFSESFSGMIPNFNRDFAYGTQVDATRYGVGVGIAGRTSIAEFSTPGTQDYWDVALRYAGEFGGFRVNGDGSDSLSFTGFDTSIQQLDASDSGAYYKVGGGLEVSAGPMTSHITFAYEKTFGIPVIVRDGTNPSQLTFGEGEVWSVKFGVSVGFGAVPGKPLYHF